MATTQYLTALDRANTVRSECAAYKRRIASGEIPLDDAIMECDLPIRVFALLKSKPGWADMKATRAIRRANIGTREMAINLMTEDERERLAAAVTNDPDAINPRPEFLTRLQRATLYDRMANAGCTLSQIDAVLQ